MDSQIERRHSIDASMHSEQSERTEQPDQEMDDDSENGSSLIQTLQFVHRGPFIYYEIREYFQQFGEIKFMQINSENGIHYGCVRIKMADYGEAILSKASHCIVNCTVNISEANIPDNGLLSPLNPLSVPPDQDAANHILILNDDCLRNVLERLNLSDLGKAADVCVRINQQAKEVFRLKYKDLSKNTVDFYRFKKSDTEIVLRNFGSLVESLGIDANLLKIFQYDKECDVVCWIAKHCCNVKKLTISNVAFNQKLKPLQPLFTKLEHFYMEKCYNYSSPDMEDTIVHLLSVCDNLKTLHFECNMEYSCEIKMKCIGRKFPLLQEANIVGYSGIEDDTLKSMVTQNPTLKKLTIRSGNSKRSSKVFRWIGQNLVNLTELEFDEGLVTSGTIGDHQNDIQCLSSLGSLNVLKLTFGSLSVTPLMESLAANEIPIEHLGLSRGLVSSAAIEAISKLKQIKILELSNTRNMTDDHLIVLAKELPHLSELHLVDSYNNEFDVNITGFTEFISHANQLSLFKLNLVNEIKIDLYDYKAMLESVQNRPKLTKLVIDIKSKAVEVDVSEEVLYQNRGCFNINLDADDSEEEEEEEEEENYYVYVECDCFD